MKHVGSGAPLRQCVLVTGFGAFPGARKNPTIAILDLLERRRGRLARLGFHLALVRLPVTYAGIGPALRQAVHAHAPDAILHLGLASRRPQLCVETRALNRAGPLHPDAVRRRPDHQVLMRGAPPVMTATYPAARIVAAIRRTGLPAYRSIDAGDYICNTTLFRTLLEGHAPQAGFLHVPLTRRAAQPIVRARLRRNQRPTIAKLAEAVLVAVIAMAAQGRRLQADKSKRRSSIG